MAKDLKLSDIDPNKEYTFKGIEIIELASQGINVYRNDMSAKLRNGIYEGVECPTCKSKVNAYTLEFNKNFVFELQALYQLGKYDQKLAVKRKDMLKAIKSADMNLGKLKHFKLVEQLKKGSYCITQKGIDFLEGNIEIEEYVWLFRDKLVRPPKKDNIKKYNVTYFINHK